MRKPTRFLLTSLSFDGRDESRWSPLADVEEKPACDWRAIVRTACKRRPPRLRDVAVGMKGRAGGAPKPAHVQGLCAKAAHDRDAKFSDALDEVFRTEGIGVIRTPVQAPNANAHAERWVRAVRADCLDRILILGRRHLEHGLRVYGRHYDEHGPHRALRLLPPNGRDPTPRNAPAPLRRRDVLGGLIHEYDAA
jgi:Integrase core domain